MVYNNSDQSGLCFTLRQYTHGDLKLNSDKFSDYSVYSSHNKIQACTVCPFCISLDQKQNDSD